MNYSMIFILKDVFNFEDPGQWPELSDVVYKIK